MKKYLILLLFSISFYNVSYAQIYNPFYGSIVNNCSYTNILANLQTFENYGVKELGTQSLDDTKNWIIDTYTNYGYTDIVEDSFTHAGQTTSNIIITKVGSVYPNEYVIIDGHYDTINGPGTNDNGSGTVAILEIARLLKDVDTSYSIKFIHFSAEELGLIGSQYYVNSVVIPNNMDIKLVFNIDEVGGINGMANNSITCERDEGPPTSNNSESAIITNELANCVSLYSNLTPEISYAYGSDYMPFEDNNEIITGFYEYNESPYTHSSNDVISNLDVNYIYEVTKAAVGASLHFSAALENTNGISENDLLNNIFVYPNPTKDMVSIDLGKIRNSIKITLKNNLGQLVLMQNFEATDYIDLSITNQETGLYFLQIETSLGKLKNIKICKD